MKIVDIVIVVVIVAVVCVALRFIRKSGGCSCGCAGCDRPCPKANKK